MGPETTVYPGILQESAANCRDLRGGTGRMVSNAEPGTDTGARALPGWEFRDALRELLEKYRDDMNRLGNRLEATAEALDRSAELYLRGEVANAALFHRAQQPW